MTITTLIRQNEHHHTDQSDFNVACSFVLCCSSQRVVNQLGKCIRCNTEKSHMKLHQNHQRNEIQCDVCNCQRVSNVSMPESFNPPCSTYKVLNTKHYIYISAKHMLRLLHTNKHCDKTKKQDENEYLKLSKRNYHPNSLQLFTNSLNENSYGHA